MRPQFDRTVRYKLYGASTHGTWNLFLEFKNGKSERRKRIMIICDLELISMTWGKCLKGLYQGYFKSMGIIILFLIYSRS